MSGRSWFVAVGDKQEGPYSEAEFHDLIARGNVRPDTYVWADGMPAWQFAGECARAAVVRPRATCPCGLRAYPFR